MHFLSLPLSPPLPNLPPRRRRFTSVNPLSPLPPSINSSHLRRAISPFERKRVSGGPREKKRKKWRATLFCTMWPKKTNRTSLKVASEKNRHWENKAQGKFIFHFLNASSVLLLLLLVTPTCLLKKHAPGLTYSGRTDTEAAWEKKENVEKGNGKSIHFHPHSPWAGGR